MDKVPTGDAAGVAPHGAPVFGVTALFHVAPSETSRQTRHRSHGPPLAVAEGHSDGETGECW